MFIFTAVSGLPDVLSDIMFFHVPPLAGVSEINHLTCWSRLSGDWSGEQKFSLKKRKKLDRPLLIGGEGLWRLYRPTKAGFF